MDHFRLVLCVLLCISSCTRAALSLLGRTETSRGKVVDRVMAIVFVGTWFVSSSEIVFGDQTPGVMVAFPLLFLAATVMYIVEFAEEPEAAT